MAHVSISSGCFITHDYEYLRRVMQKTNADSVEIIVYKSIIKDMGVLEEHFKEFEKDIYSLHAPKPVQILLSDPSFHPSALKILKKAADVACNLGAPVLVVHAWDGRFRELPMEEIKGTMSLFSSYAGNMGVNVSIEALPSRCMAPPILVNELLSCSEDITFTLDFEYAAAYDMFDELLLNADRLSNVHLRDFNGNWMKDGRRAYLRPGQGDLDFRDLIKRIKSTGYDSAYTIEAPYNKVDDLNEDIGFFNGII